MNNNALLNKTGILIQGDNYQALEALINNYKSKIDLVYIDHPFNTNLNFYYSVDKTTHISSVGTSQIAYSDKFDFDEYLDFIEKRIILIYDF